MLLSSAYDGWLSDKPLPAVHCIFLFAEVHAAPLQSDFKRGKRYKKLLKVLSSKRAQVANTRFYSHTYAITAALFVAHLVFFAIFITFLGRQRAYVYETDAAGRALNNAFRCGCTRHSRASLPSAVAHLS